MSQDRWKDGLRLEDALLETTPPPIRNELEQLRRYDSLVTSLGESSDSPKWVFRRLWTAAVEEFLGKLRRGELRATGYLVGGVSESSQIPQDRWQILKPDFRESSAQGFS